MNNSTSINFKNSSEMDMFLEKYKLSNWGTFGSSVSYVAAFSLGHDPGVLGLSPALGFLFSGESVSPSPLLCSLILCLINK